MRQRRVRAIYGKRIVKEGTGAQPEWAESWKVEKQQSRKMKPTGILALLALSACANLAPPTASYPNLPKESMTDTVHDQLDDHPTTLTAVEAQKAAKARF